MKLQQKQGGLVMKAFLCLLLVILSFVSYIILSRNVGFYQHQYHPILHYAGMVAGIGLLIWMMVKKFTIPRLVLAILSVLIVCFALWYTMVFSQYEDTKSNIIVGDVVDEGLRQISLVSTSGESVKLGEIFENNRATLVVFVRAEW
jgi:peptidoglycan/LPS O-acetylase OafA/YrhL